jgi:hypothetical protein
MMFAALVPVMFVVMLLVTPSASWGDLAPPPGVYVIGDSVVLGAESALVAALAPAPVTVDAQVSRSLLGAVSVLQQARPGIGDVAVVALGTNDGTDPVEFAHRIDLVMGALQGVPHVLWLDQREFEPGRAALNDQLRAATARYPTLRVLGWNAVVAANPADVGPDGIHVTAAGAAAMGALVRQAVDEVRTPPPTPALAPGPLATPAPAPVTPAPAARDVQAGAVRPRPGDSGPPVGTIVLVGALASIAAGALALTLARHPLRLAALARRHSALG